MTPGRNTVLDKIQTCLPRILRTKRKRQLRRWKDIKLVVVYSEQGFPPTHPTLRPSFRLCLLFQTVIKIHRSSYFRMSMMWFSVVSSLSTFSDIYTLVKTLNLFIIWWRTSLLSPFFTSKYMACWSRFLLVFKL